MDVPLLLHQFLTISCHLQPDETALLWRCLSFPPRQTIAYRLERLPAQALGPGGHRGGQCLRRVLDPQGLILALERAVESGHACRSEASKIEEAILAEMTSQGRGGRDGAHARADGGGGVASSHSA